MPPNDVATGALSFMPAPDVRDWAYSTFIKTGGALVNPDHGHLSSANLAFLWAGDPFTRKLKIVLGTAEMPSCMGNAWLRARFECQMLGWFGTMPDFLITLFAPAAAIMDDRTFCALVEHELYHCGQETDSEGMPKFTKTGMPVFAMRGHDVEEFVGVVKRYGLTDRHQVEFAAAAAAGALTSEEHIEIACGTCRKAA